ncbi:DNA-binding protein [Pseudomonas carnis]|uniref:DNA-binding protein n=1 Tax=Pseudomonas carnis TaxID=2487355 RepID=UPI0018E8D313|nr:DNA-binding protein [Pseudomonas carnis]MBJ2215796.1 DNA-binding protein [Pseudomonas carnis]
MGTRGRVPVSREEVREAIESLQKEGRTPTIRAVRDFIQRGSLGTIKAHMDALIANAATPGDHLKAFGPRLGALCEEMINHMRELADETLATERAQFEQRRENHESQWKAVNHARELAQSQLEIERRHSHEQKSRIKDLEKSLQTSQSELQSIQNQLNTSMQEVAKANAQVVNLTAKVDQTESALKTARTQHAHYEQEMKAQQLEKDERHEQVVGQLNGKVRALEENNSELKVEVSKWKGQNATTEERLNRANDALEGAKLERTNLQEAHDKLQELVGTLSIQQTKDAAALTKATSQIGEARNEVAAKSNTITQLQGDMINMQKQAETARQSAAEEHKGLIRNLIAHSRTAFEMAKAATPKGSSELEELERSQRNIEQLLA